MLSPQDLKEFQAAGTEMCAPVNGIRYNAFSVFNEKAWVNKICMVGGVRKVEKIIIFNVRSKPPGPPQVDPFLNVFHVSPFIRHPFLEERIFYQGLRLVICSKPGRDKIRYCYDGFFLGLVVCKLKGTDDEIEAVFL
jgi:hypothetical protein